MHGGRDAKVKMVFYAVLSADFNEKELRKPRSPRAFGWLLNHV